MKFPDWLPVYGDKTYRGKCPRETVEQVTFVNYVRREWPDTLGMILLHPRNEGKRHEIKAQREKAEGMAPGASDVIIPASPSFVCEMKRRDHTQCSWEPSQLPYLEAAKNAGAFVCVALGHEGAKLALADWLAQKNPSP